MAEIEFTVDAERYHVVEERLRRRLRIRAARADRDDAVLGLEHVAGAGDDERRGSVGDSYDNALAETIIGLYKTEVIHRRGPWRHIDAVEYATLEWIDWFNHRRLLEPIGNVPPAELESAYHRQQQALAMAA